MSNKLQPVRGTKDLFLEDFERFQFIVDTARRVGESYGFKGCSTPIFEFTDVFKRTLGDASDVVNKEMYTFADRGGDSITLRPEFTAGIARAFISNGLQQNLPLKLFSHGPLFRYERPQKGRQRQFHQINFEWLGENSPYADVELIVMAAQFLYELGIGPKVKLLINTLGDAESRKNYSDALVGYLQKHKSDLSEDSQDRLGINPLRILDSKDENDRKIIAGAPSIMEYLTPSADAFYKTVSHEVRNLVKVGGKEFIPVEADYLSVGVDISNPSHLGISSDGEKMLVRGLDYYTHTVFEFISDSGELGSQNTVLGGGRYDGLIKRMGGPDTPALGFAAGIERLALLTEWKDGTDDPIVVILLEDVKVTTIDDVKMSPMFYIGNGVRRAANVPVCTIFEKNIGKALKKADKMKATHAVIVGQDEADNRKLTIKDMRSAETRQVTLDFAAALEFLKRERS